MSGLNRVTSFVVLAAVGVGGPAAVRGVRAEPERSVASRSVLLLANRNVLTGVISRNGDRYRVEQESSVLFVRADNVLRVDASIDALYAYLRDQIAIGGAFDHLRLARWCLHQGLLGYAAREILDARRLEPHHPALVRLERELEFRTHPAANPRRPRSATRHHQQHARQSGRSAFDRDGGSDQPTPSPVRSRKTRNDRSGTHAASGKGGRSHRPSRNGMARTRAERQPSSGDAPHDPFDPEEFNRRNAGKP